MASIDDMIAQLDSGQQRVRDPAQPGRLLLNGAEATRDTPVAAGDELEIGPRWYRILGGLGGFLYPAPLPPQQVTHPVRLHAGLHKCLTMFSRQVYHNAAIARTLTLNWGMWRVPIAKHFHHKVDDFHAGLHRARTQSLSGVALDLDAYDDILVVRFVRDPRDLLVSGYHYHRKGAEPWTRVPSPEPKHFAEVNGGVPEAIRGRGPSLQDYLGAVDKAVGLAAELEFRRPHFRAMMAWPEEDERILTFRYEDILGHEEEVFEVIGQHFGWNRAERAAARATARAYSSGGREAKKGHVRNKAPGQWREELDEALNARIVEEFGPLLRAHGYPET